MLLIHFTCFPQDKSKLVVYRRKIYCPVELFQHYNNMTLCDCWELHRIMVASLPCSKLPVGNNYIYTKNLSHFAYKK